jgi:tetratricopeptide (TPR) repeat protein
MVEQSNTHKAEANTLFGEEKYDAAINKYDEAVAVCPNYLDYELAVLKSNIAACHTELHEWKEAVNNATTALDNLDRLERAEKEKSASEENDSKSEVEEEIISAGAAKAGPPLPKEEDHAKVARRKRADDISRIRMKALMRRARARGELGGWSNLEGAIKDYESLRDMPNLSSVNVRKVREQLRLLPPRAKAAQEKETADALSKLKDLGNSILSPFGLSTDNFKMVKDEKTGGYSMNFQSDGKGSAS